jgi:Lrp/AsnC family transcriptional regulator, leucine-responsive regulatory protein
MGRNAEGAGDDYGIDEVDRKIVELLEGDPALSHREIAEAVDRSQPTVGKRVKELLESGFLDHGFGPRLGGGARLALVRARGSDLRRVAKELSARDGVVLTALVSGEWGLFALFSGRGCREVSRLVDELLGCREEIREVSVEFSLGLFTQRKVLLRLEDVLPAPREARGVGGER